MSEEPLATILVVDDNVANVALLEGYLLTEGYQVVKAYDGEEALQKVSEEKPDLILLDVMMPRLDGFEVCSRLREDPATQFLPIVMVTALQEREHRLRGIEVGADDFLTKPVDDNELLLRVRSLLRIKRFHDQLEEYSRHLEEMVAQRTAELRQALEELRQLDRMKGEFLATISHELRTPLAHVLGYIDLLKEGLLGPLNEQQAEALAVAQKQTYHLRSLIDSLIDFVSLEQAEESLDLGTWPLEELLARAVSEIRPRYEEKGVQLQEAWSEGLPLVFVDPDRIHHVLMALLDNGLKFTPSGGKVTVKASLNQTPPGSPELVTVSVEDTGIGIPAEHLDRIFDYFYQVDSSSTRRYEGMGMGLAIAK